MVRTRTSPIGSEQDRRAVPVYSLGRGRAAGFTLVELLVVLLIAIVLFAVVPPLLTGAIGGAELRDAARRLAAGLKIARTQAIAHSKPSVLTVDVDNRRFTVPGREAAYRLPEDLEISLVTTEAEVRGEGVGGIRFFPDGSSTGGRITLESERRAYLLDVDWLTGRVTVTAE